MTSARRSADLVVIDADTYFPEPWDPWTSRAPAMYADLVPQVHPVGHRTVQAERLPLFLVRTTTGSFAR